MSDEQPCTMCMCKKCFDARVQRASRDHQRDADLSRRIEELGRMMERIARLSGVGAVARMEEKVEELDRRTAGLIVLG